MHADGLVCHSSAPALLNTWGVVVVVVVVHSSQSSSAEGLLSPAGKRLRLSNMSTSHSVLSAQGPLGCFRCAPSRACWDGDAGQD